MINHQPDIDKIYLCTDDSYEAKHQLLINKWILMILKLLMNILVAEMLSIRVLMNTIQIKKRNVLIVFDDMIVDMFSHKTLNQ